MPQQRCPRCNSPQPHLHPAMQHGGEVQPCQHEFHEGRFPVAEEPSDEDKREPHDIGRIAYEAAAAATGCVQPWEQADQAKWAAAARGVLEWACNQMENEAKYGCPCTEDERLTLENADLLRELGGLPQRTAILTPNAGIHRAAEGRPVE